MRGPVGQLEPAFPGKTGRLGYASGGVISATVVTQCLSEFATRAFNTGICGVEAVASVYSRVKDAGGCRLIVKMVNRFKVAIPNAGFVGLVSGYRRIAVTIGRAWYQWYLTATAA